MVGGGGDPTKRGVVSTASYEARKFGIHSAMPLKTAYRLCPTCVFLPVDYEAYSLESEKIKNILLAFTPLMEDVGIDEAFLDISQIDRPAEEIAEGIKKRIKEDTGLTCSIGVAPNKLLAKIASDMQKPNGLTIINDADVERCIWPLGVRKLGGVGPKTEAYLKREGIQTIGELAAVHLETLILWLGKSFGKYLYEASRGIDECPIITDWEPKSTSRETTFQEDIDNLEVLEKVLEKLTGEVVSDLRQRGYRGKTVTVKIRFNDFKTHTRTRTLPELTDSLEKIGKAANLCLRRFEFQKKVRLIGIRVGRLQRITSP